MRGVLRLALVATMPLLLTFAGCAAAPAASGHSSKLTGDENGGKIADALGLAQAQSMQLLTEHCAKHGRKGFITKMDYDGNTMTFQCLRQRS